MSSKQRPAQYADQRYSLLDCFLPNISAISEGPTLPTDATAGWSPGALWLLRDSTALSGAQLYVNEGTKTSCDFNPIAQVGNTPVNVTAAAVTITPAAHGNRWVTLNRATGVAVTLPTFAGTGVTYKFFIGTATSGGSQVITATGAFLFGGVVQNTDTGGTGLFGVNVATNAGGSTTITLDGATQGGRKGDWITITDLGVGVGLVQGMLNASGTEATPFS